MPPKKVDPEALKKEKSIAKERSGKSFRKHTAKLKASIISANLQKNPINFPAFLL
jgi:hypothetical protein